MRQFINQNKWIVIILCILVGIYFLWPIITESTVTMPDKPIMVSKDSSVHSWNMEGTTEDNHTNQTMKGDSNLQSVDRDSHMSTLEENSTEGILVYITGAVQNPGLYKAPISSHVHDVISLAGGLLPYGDGESLNMAEEVQSGSHIHVRFNFNGNPEALLRTQKININTASEKELDTLPGVGPAMAKRINEYRQTKGAFTSIDDIKHVKGIGDGVFKKIKDKITI